jgi:hypothetical protein
MRLEVRKSKSSRSSHSHLYPLTSGLRSSKDGSTLLDNEGRLFYVPLSNEKQSSYLCNEEPLFLLFSLIPLRV